jgi:hypothetical protein
MSLTHWSRLTEASGMFGQRLTALRDESWLPGVTHFLHDARAFRPEFPSGYGFISDPIECGGTGEDARRSIESISGSVLRGIEE